MSKAIYLPAQRNRQPARPTPQTEAPPLHPGKANPCPVLHWPAIWNHLHIEDSCGFQWCDVDTVTPEFPQTLHNTSLIRKVFDMWESTLQDAFVPDENVTVDEQLLTYRGRVPFKQYIPSKPGKYGIKLWMLSDTKTSYVCRIQVYSGRAGNQHR